MLEKQKNKYQNGFTLLELLVVIAIIGILSGVVSVAVSSARVKARDAKRVGDMRQILTALEQYYIKNGYYPTGTASVSSFGSGSVLDDPGAMNGGTDAFVPNYLPFMPKAPIPADGPCGGQAGSGQNNYWYESADDGVHYTLSFCLGQDNESWPQGTRRITPNGIQ